MHERRRRSTKLKLNWKLVLLPFGLLAVISICTAAWRAAYMPDADDHFRAAEAARNDRAFSAAIIHYKNVLLEAPDNLEARWRLGQIYLTLKQIPDAVSALENARSFGERQPEVWLDLARAQIEAGEFSDSLSTLARYTGPDQSAAEALKARANLALGESDTAKALLSAATRRDPDALSLHLATARLAISEHDLVGTDAAITKALALAPDSTEALLLQGRARMLQGRATDAATAYRRASELMTTGNEALAGLAEALLAGGKTDEAVAIVGQLEARSPGTVGVEFLKGWLAYARQEWAQAESALLLVVKAAPKHPQALLMLGDSCFRQAKFNQAEEYLKAFDGYFPDQPQALKMLGALYIKQGRAVDAIKIMTPLATASNGKPDAGTLALLSYAHYAAGEMDQGKAYLEQAQSLAPESKLLQTQEALGDIAAGHTAVGIGDLEKLAAGADGGPSRQALTYVHLLQGDAESALQSARALIDLKPEDPLAHNLLGIALAKNNDPEAARAAFKKALSSNAKFAPALANLGFLAFANGAADQGETYLRQALAADKSYTAASLALAAVAEGKGLMEDATRLLEDAIAAQPQAAQPKWLLADRRLRAGATEDASKLAEAAYALAPNAIQSRLRWGIFLLQAGRAADAIDILTALHEDAPEFTPATVALGHASRAAGRWDPARTHYRTVLHGAPERLDILWSLLAVEIGAKDYPAAEDVIDNMRSHHPTTQDAARARGELALAQGRPADAVVIFEKIFKETPGSATLMRLVDALQQKGDTDAMQENMTTWLTEHPEDTPVRLRLGTFELMTGMSRAAQTTFEDALKHAPENAIALNNLAWLYDQADDDRALGLAERAYQALPNSPEAADTLGWIMVRRDEARNALPLFEKARERMPAEPNIQFHHAFALAEIGSTDKARELLTALFAQQTDFESANEARALLRRLSTNAETEMDAAPGSRF